MVAGGQESMSKIPFYLLREPLKYGSNMIHVSTPISCIFMFLCFPMKIFYHL